MKGTRNEKARQKAGSKSDNPIRPSDFEQQDDHIIKGSSNFEQHEKGPIFERCPHDRENPYTMVNNHLIRDESISPACRWLLIYLLSNASGWKIQISQIIGHVKGFVGRHKVYKLVEEAIMAGYMQRIIFREKNLNRSKYIVSEFPKFKKCSPLPENQDVEKPNMENSKEEELKKSFRHPGCRHAEGRNAEGRHHKERTISSNEDKKEQYKETSAAAESLTYLLFAKIKENIRSFKPALDKPPPKWFEEMDRLLRIDKRSEEEIRFVIENYSFNAWYKSHLQSPAALRNHFDQIKGSLDYRSEKQRVNENRRFALDLKEQYPNETKGLIFNETHVINRHTGKDLPFNLPQQTFRESIFHLFGGEYGGD